MPGSTLMELADSPWRARGCRRWILQNEHHLKQGIAIQAAGHTERLQDFLDRQFLVSIGIQRHLPYTPQDLTECGVAR